MGDVFGPSLSPFLDSLWAAGGPIALRFAGFFQLMTGIAVLFFAFALVDHFVLGSAHFSSSSSGSSGGSYSARGSIGTMSLPRSVRRELSSAWAAGNKPQGSGKSHSSVAAMAPRKYNGAPTAPHREAYEGQYSDYYVI